MYKPPLSAISSFLLQCQEMVNCVLKEIAIASSNEPPFQPYLVPKLFEHHWMPPDIDHVAARTKWLGYAKQEKRHTDPKELSIQSPPPL